MSVPQLVAAEKMGENIFIEFDDGKFALYPAPVLYDLLSQIATVEVPDLDGEVESDTDPLSSSGDWTEPNAPNGLPQP